MKKKLILPTEEEEKRINRGITRDHDNPEWTDDDFAQARPGREVMTELLGSDRVGDLFRLRGRPKKEMPKKAVSLRLDPEVIAWFKSQGKGYQSAINDVLKHHVETRLRHHRKAA
jgi:uncharacterized protein (DUF4415 family)